MYEITRGKSLKPVKAVCYGVEGVGKTTFASKWPGAVFIDVEDGSGHYDVARLPRPESWPLLLDELMAATVMPEVGTLVIDTVDAAEALCIAHVLSVKKWKSIEDAGFGKGYTYLAEEFGKLFASLDRIVASGKNVLLLAHAQIRKFEQPDELGAYDRWELKLQKKCSPIVKEWCDLLLFADYKTDVMTSQDGKKAKATGGRKRVMYASHTAAWDAKNRLGLPDKMPFEFEAIADKVPVTPEERQARAKHVLEMPADEAEAQAGAEAAASHIEQMNEYVKVIAAGNMDAKPPKFEEVTEPEFMQLKQLMADYQVNEAQLRAAVGAMSNNPYTDSTPVSEYSIKFVGNLLKHWEQVADEAKKASSVYDEDIPF